jgi:hypothetical protein
MPKPPTPERTEEVLSITREAIGECQLKALDDERVLEFYTTLRNLYSVQDKGAYIRMAHIVMSWGVLSDPKEMVIRNAIGRVGKRLFGRIGERKVKPWKGIAAGKHEEGQQLNQREQQIQSDLRKRYDPLRRMIGLADKLERKLDTILENQYSDASDVSKIANSLQGTFTQIIELLKLLKILGDGTSDDYRGRIQIENLQMVVQQGVDNRDTLGAALGKFANAMTTMGTRQPQLETTRDATGLYKPVCEPESGTGDVVELGEGIGGEPVGHPTGGSVSPEPPAGSHGTDPA